MKKKTLAFLAVLLMMAFTLGACGSSGGGEESGDGDASAEAPKVTANTGTYTGQMNDGIEEYLGIPYAEAEHFKAPTDVTTTSEDEIDATSWGENCIQPYDEVELASQDPCSQNCQFLNVWTKDSSTTGKPVIVWIHGGSYIWGGATDPMYDGENFVRNLPEGEDMVFISINYRLSFMGSADLSVLDGYTDEYADALNLAKLDQTQALKWTSENVEAWGGDPENITIMGHSSGGGAVFQLMADPDSNQYFSRCIEHSGVPFFTMCSREQTKERSAKIFEILGVKTVDELVALTDEQISDKMTQINEEVELGNVVADGEIISEDWWEEFQNGSAKDIELLIGGVSGENDYYAFDEENYPEPTDDYNVVYQHIKDLNEEYKGVKGRQQVSDELVQEYLALGDDKVKLMMDMYNNLAAPWTSEKIAQAQCQNNENTYVYYWEYSPSKEDVMEYSGDAAEVSPWSRPLHSMDVCFAFGTLEDGYTELTGDPAKLPKELSPQTQAAWYAFAKTGDPSNDLTGKWDKYTTDERSVMDITPDAEWKNVKNFHEDSYNILDKVDFQFD